MKKKHFYAAVILLAFLATGIQPALAVINLTSNGWEKDGVSLNDVHYWDGATTFRLKQNVNETIQIDISGTISQPVILDGDEFTVDLGNSSYTGVSLAGRSYVTIRDINITGSNKQGSGITLNPSGYCNVINNTISGRQEGIFMSNAGTCIIEGNTISNNVWGILVQAPTNSLNNILNNNTIEENNLGIEFGGGTHHNKIYNNNFIDNTMQATDHGANNEFDLGDPALGYEGGNYWSDYTGEDTDDDGIGETAYTFTGGQDEFPWVFQTGWSNEPPIADAGFDQTVEQDSFAPPGASVTLDGSGSSDDSQIQPLAYTWSWDGGGSSTGVTPTVTLPLGMTTVTLTVYDGVLNDSDTVDITVQSVQPPEDAPQDVVADIIDFIIEDMYVPKEAEKEVGKAVKELNKAIKEFNKGKIDKAIKKISKAVKELKKAQKKGADTQGVIDDLDDLVQGL